MKNSLYFNVVAVVLFLSISVGVRAQSNGDRYLNVKSFGLELQDFMNAGQPQFLLKKIESKMLKPIHAQYGETIKRTGLEPAALLAGVAGQFALYTRWELLQVIEAENDYQLIFRIETDEDIFDFIVFNIISYDNGPKIIDWYVYSSDSWTSSGLLRLMEVLDRHSSPDEFSSILDFVSYKGNGVLKKYRKLSTAIKLERLVKDTLITKLVTVGEVDDLRERLALADENRFTFLRMNIARESGNYNVALEQLEKLKTVIGDDLQLVFVQAEILMELGRGPEALELVEGLIRLYSQESEVFEITFALLSKYGFYKQAVLAMRILEQDFEYEFAQEDLALVSEFMGFVESAEYQEYLLSKS